MAILLLNNATSKFELYKIKTNNQKIKDLNKTQMSKEYGDLLGESMQDGLVACKYHPSWAKIYYKLSTFSYESSIREGDIYDSTIFARCALKLEPKNSVFKEHAIKVQKALETIDKKYKK